LIGLVSNIAIAPNPRKAGSVSLALWELPELPQHLVISSPEELEAFEIEPDTLK